jgi:hypothetical protein
MPTHDARIVTHYDPKPIPPRQFDWSAVDDRTCDGEGCPVGYGATEKAAIDDLLDQICKDHGADTDVNLGCRYCSADHAVACRAKITSSRPTTDHRE